MQGVEAGRLRVRIGLKGAGIRWSTCRSTSDSIGTLYVACLLAHAAVYYHDTHRRQIDSITTLCCAIGTPGGRMDQLWASSEVQHSRSARRNSQQCKAKNISAIIVGLGLGLRCQSVQVRFRRQVSTGSLMVSLTALQAFRPRCHCFWRPGAEVSEDSQAFTVRRTNLAVWP